MVVETAVERLPHPLRYHRKNEPSDGLTPPLLLVKPMAVVVASATAILEVPVGSDQP